MCAACVCVCVCVCVCNDVDGQNIVQTDNESCESAITGHYRKPNPIQTLFSLGFLYPPSLQTQSILIYRSACVYIKKVKSPYLHNHKSSFCLLYTHTETRPCQYPPIYSLRDTHLFADASQRPEYHCCDDLLNGKWYHTGPLCIKP